MDASFSPTEDDEQLVWYASYGSNMCRKRFMCYITGGAVPGMRTPCRGCTDTREPLQDCWTALHHELYFRKDSGTWGGGGVCFADYWRNSTTVLYVRMYLIRIQQFIDVVRQENGGMMIPRLTPEALAELAEGHYGSALRVHDSSWYNHVAFLGRHQRHPIFSFTCDMGEVHTQLRPPSPAYLAIIQQGLAEGRMQEPYLAAYLAYHQQPPDARAIAACQRAIPPCGSSLVLPSGHVLHHLAARPQLVVRNIAPAWSLRLQRGPAELATQRGAAAVRALLVFAEEELGIRDYHFRIEPLPPTPGDSTPDAADAATPTSAASEDAAEEEREARGAGGADSVELLLLYGLLRDGPLDTDRPCLSCDDVPLSADGSLHSRDTHLPTSEPGVMDAWLDAQGRPVYVITPAQHVERLTDMSEEQLRVMFSVALRCLRLHDPPAPFLHIVVNHGTFRNVSHVHMKVWLEEVVFRERWEEHPVFQLLQRKRLERMQPGGLHPALPHAT